TDWLIKPRVAEEVDESLGGGVVYRHAPHLIDTVRLLGGGKLRSVRAMADRWMPERPCPDTFSAYLDCGDGTPATTVVAGYGDFGRREVRVEGGRGTGTVEMADMYAAVTEDKPIVHDGRWGMATLEVGQAMVQSARERREILLTKQCSAPE